MKEGTLKVTMRRAEKLAKTRTAIMNTATKLFLENGFAGTSTRDIAKEIGITQPALYHHFSDKEVLFLDVLTEHCAKVRQGINRVMRKDDIDPKERLWEITQVLLRNHPRDVYEQWKAAEQLLSSSSKRKLDMIFMMDYIDPVSEYFKLPDVSLRPDVRPKEAAELYIADLAPLFGSFQEIGGHSISSENRSKIILDVFINGVSRK